jgi:hypothetical protein
MENLKSITAYDLGSPTIVGEKFNLNVGDKEVIEVRSLYCYMAVMGLTAGCNSVYLGLYRKSEKLPKNIGYKDDGDMIWSTRWQRHFVTESVGSSKSEYIIFPKPIILLRPPQLVHQYNNFVSVVVQMRLYYTIKKLSSQELAKLMIKDHD